MAINRQVWQEKAGVPGEIREVIKPDTVADDQILVKVHAWALNPADAMIQETHLTFMPYPLIMGEDISGTVELVGSAAASHFKTGDRVTAATSAMQNPERGAFQEFVITDHKMACKIPDTLSFVDASVFPLCIATAAMALFAKSYLGLPFPKLGLTPNLGRSIFIWGGSSGVGANAIQLCKACGYDVVTTCSARNFNFVKQLGADKAFDYNQADVVDKVAAELDKGECVGIFNAAGPADMPCQVSAKSKQKLFVAATNPIQEGAAPNGVEAKWLFSSDGSNPYYETLPATFGNFLPESLAQGIYKVAPQPEVVPTKGLEGIQEALDILKKGVSAKKLVIVAE